ncbi:MAG TPA: hypothetical protein VGD40_00940 [Chryseosolibacter sp.]
MRFLVSLLFCAIVFQTTGQDQSLRELDKTLNAYYQNTAPLKVHLALNQPSYVAGDTIFFRATVVNEFDRKPIDKNSILHVMLMNDAGNAVVNQKVRLENGTAVNQLVTPAAINPGLYVLVAYHDWMKNFSPDFFFQTYILIHGQQQFSRSPDANLQFYPEGGHLASGVENRLIAKGGNNTVVTVADAQGQTQATFSTNENGFGSFTLTPQAGAVYTATAQNRTFALPKTEEDAVAMRVRLSQDGNGIDVSIATAHQAIQRARVVLDASGDVFYNTLLKVDQGKLEVSIPTNELTHGVARISVFGEKGNLLAERLVFIPMLSSMKGNVELNGALFGTRQKVTAKVKLTSNEDLAGTIVSATVFNKTLFGDLMHSATANFALYSNMPGSLTNAQTRFQPETPAWREAIDFAMIANSKSRSPWADVLAKKQPGERLTNIRFTGQLVNEKTGAIFTDTTFVTLFLQKNVVTYQTFTNKGKFDLPLYIDFFGQDEVYYRIEKRGKTVPDVRIEIVEEPTLTIDWPVVQESPTVDPVYVNARQQRLITNSFGYNQKAHNYRKVTSPNAQIEEEIFGADTEIDLEKFLVFPTMEETIREIIPMVQHRRIKNVSTIRVYFSDVNRQATVSPVFIIDGVMTDDTDYFMSLKPSDVAKIKVVNTREKLQTFGAIGRGGVILVETKITDNFSKVPRSKNSFVVHGLSEPVKVNTFDGRSFKDKVPDLRTSLYWNPSIVLDENGEASFSFFTSDVTGEYSIVVDGITTSGEPVQLESNLSVEFKPSAN